MNTHTRIDRRLPPDLEDEDPHTNTMTLSPTVLADDLKLDDSADYDCDPYNSAPTSALDRKRNSTLP